MSEVSVDFIQNWLSGNGGDLGSIFYAINTIREDTIIPLPMGNTQEVAVIDVLGHEGKSPVS